MSERKRKVYRSMNNVARKAKRNFSKLLNEDLEHWGETSEQVPQSSPLEHDDDDDLTGQATHSKVSVKSSEMALFKIKDNAVAAKPVDDVAPCHDTSCVASSSQIASDFQSSDDVTKCLVSSSETGCGSDNLNDYETENITDGVDEREGNASYLWNLSFIHQSEVCGESFDLFETESSSVGNYEGLLLRYNCELCIACRCSTCFECQHTDGVTCVHCKHCRLNTDSDAESTGSVSSCGNDDSDSDQFDLNPSELLSEEEKQNEKVKSQFVDIVLEENASHVLVGKLLNFFRRNNFGNFPKTAKTLLKTPTFTKMRSVPPGEYWHRGIKKDLMKFIAGTGCSNVRISFSVDGVPLAASAGTDFYPLCCSFNDSKDIVLAGLYFGKGKPTSSNEFLKDFVEEINELVENGIVCEGKLVSVEVYLCICDAVAKAWLLNVKGHSGYFSCCKCTVEGVNVDGTVVFLDHKAAKRTNESFLAQQQEEHHHGPTILSSLKSFQPVSNVILDYMHLVLLGTFRKIAYMLIAGPKRVRQSAIVVCVISNLLTAAAEWVPSDFARKPRSLLYVKRFKATEWRMILLYLAPVVFQSNLPGAIYEHILVLHVSILILSCHDHLQTHLDYARDLLTYFVEVFKLLYGKKYVSHNIHNLTHLADDCRAHGPLDGFSAFKYENFYQKLKKMVRKGNQPLQQLARRYEEQNRRKPTQSCMSSSSDIVSGVHTNGPLPPWCTNPQYSSLKSGFGKLNLTQANNCCSLSDGSIVVAGGINGPPSPN